MTTKSETISVRVTKDMYDFFDNRRKMIEKETGVEVPMGAIITRALKAFITHAECMHGGDRHGALGKSPEERIAHMKTRMEKLVQEYKELLQEEK